MNALIKPSTGRWCFYDFLQRIVNKKLCFVCFSICRRRMSVLWEFFFINTHFVFFKDPNYTETTYLTTTAVQRNMHYNNATLFPVLVQPVNSLIKWARMSIQLQFWYIVLSPYFPVPSDRYYYYCIYKSK